MADRKSWNIRDLYNRSIQESGKEEGFKRFANAINGDGFFVEIDNMLWKGDINYSENGSFLNWSFKNVNNRKLEMRPADLSGSGGNYPIDIDSYLDFIDKSGAKLVSEPSIPFEQHLNLDTRANYLPDNISVDKYLDYYKTEFTNGNLEGDAYLNVLKNAEFNLNRKSNPIDKNTDIPRLTSRLDKNKLQFFDKIKKEGYDAAVEQGYDPYWDKYQHKYNDLTQENLDYILKEEERVRKNIKPSNPEPKIDIKDTKKTDNISPNRSYKEIAENDYVTLDNLVQHSKLTVPEENLHSDINNIFNNVAYKPAEDGTTKSPYFWLDENKKLQMANDNGADFQPDLRMQEGHRNLKKENYFSNEENINEALNMLKDQGYEMDLQNTEKMFYDLDKKLNDFDEHYNNNKNLYNNPPSNKQVDVSIDDFKPADELEQMNIEDDNEIDVTHLFEENESQKVKSRAEEYTDKLDELETKYSNGDISDIEYAKEQQRLQDIFEKENPVDVSNVLSDQKEPPFNIDDFSMPNIDEIDIEKKLWKDAEKQKLPNEPLYKKSDTYDLNLQRENRTYLNESEYFDQVDRIEEMYNNGDLTDQEYADELNRSKKDYVPELVDQANEETKQYIKDNLEQEPFDPELERLYINPKDRKNIISKQNQGDYNANVTNGFVDDITVGDETYNFKYRNGEKTVVDIYDSNDNLVTDKDLYDDILSKGKQERDNFYKNLSDEEWDTVINNAEDFRFDKHKDALESNRKLRNQNDAIKMKQEVLKEKSDKYQTEYENEKSKKKRKEIEKKRNNSEIDILQAEKLKKKNDLKLEARNERQVAREAFQKKVKEEGLEKGTEAYNEALKELKESFKNSEKTMEKRIASSNKALDAQIKGWSGKGLTLKNAVTIGFSAKAAVDKYKEARAEGKSAGSAAIRAGASAVAAEVLGPLGSTALMAAQVAPKAIVAGADALYKEHRRMNSASNFVPLGGVNFQDSQELATMRQSGMELAKMSQYNLEQSLMGAEAKHLHR